MEKNKFYELVWSSVYVFHWLVVYRTVIGDNVLEFLEQVRGGLVNEMPKEQVEDAIVEGIKAIIAA